MPLKLEINEEFRRAFALVEEGRRHLFVTGNAGTGKSTFLDYCAEQASGNLVLLAPTGVAALNIRGQTIHRFFNFPVDVTPDKIMRRQIRPRSKKMFQSLRTIVIDEASMLRADLLDTIDVFLRLYGPSSQEPFGGIQMVFVGDLCQLPPVVSPAERGHFSEQYATPYFFSARVMEEIDLEVVEFNKIYRQRDRDFIDLLNRIRENTVTTADLALLNTRVGLPDQADGLIDFPVVLTATNQLAAAVNRRELEALPGRLYQHAAEVDGSFETASFPNDDMLTFKLGAQVMFLNNDAKNRWVNGSVGRIEAVTENGGRLKHVKIRLRHNHRAVEVFPYTWELFKYRLENGEIVSEAVGSFTQFPFRLAWAVTIHKSQGKTFDQVEIDLGRGSFAPGQLYVALSRAVSFEGIRLSRPVRREDVFTDSRLAAFMACYNDRPTPENLKRHLLAQAIAAQRKVEIIYCKPNREESRRIIVPLSLRGENLLAFCTQRQEQRTFSLPRIRKIFLTPRGT